MVDIRARIRFNWAIGRCQGFNYDGGLMVIANDEFL